MSTDEMVDTIRKLGGVLKLEGANVRCSLPAAAAHLAGELRERKPELISLLKARGGRIANLPHCPTCASYALYRGRHRRLRVPHLRTAGDRRDNGPEAGMNNIEVMMREFVRSSVHLKRKLYRRDEAASTTPEGMEGPRIAVHTCRLCNRAAAGDGAQVRHKADCPLPRLQKAQTALREAWPELFAGKSAPEKKAAAQVRART
ncbi:hypothetical protein [Tunturiibacter gelidiferens]|uniref:hypothetical protein n=1 Tax=Tunturiibacter gelidiferens TaxID=3069689 RepID=UPI003D9BA709